MISAIIRRIKLDKVNAKDEEIVEAIEEVLSSREKEVLTYRLPWTQEEVAKKFKLTKERIRAIEARLFEKVMEYLV